MCSFPKLSCRIYHSVTVTASDQSGQKAAWLRHRDVIAIVIPVTLASLSTPLVGLVDTGVIGRLGDPAAIGGVAAAGIIANVVLYAFNFLKFSTTGLTAQATGRGQPLEAAATILRALTVALCAGGLALILHRPLIALGMSLLGLDPQTRIMAGTYLSIRVWSLPFMLANYAILGFLLGRGSVGRAFVLQLLLNFTNIAGSIGLVLGLGFGVAGAALSTVIAETVTALAGGIMVFGYTRPYMQDVLAVLPDRAALWRLFHIGVDILIRSLALLSGIALFTRMAAGSGTVVLAANMILLNLFYLSGALLDGVATAAQQLSGRAFGAGNRVLFNRMLRLVFTWGVIIGGAVSLAYFTVRIPFSALMATAEDVRAAVLRYYGWVALIPLVGSFSFVLDGIFVGATWTREMRNMMLASLVAFTIAAPALKAVWGNDGLWAAFLLFLSARALTLAIQLVRLAPEKFRS